MNQPPWESALLAAQQKQAERLQAAEEEILRLRVTVTGLKRRLYEARVRQENWLLRQQAWRAERAELLARRSKAADTTDAWRERNRLHLGEGDFQFEAPK